MDFKKIYFYIQDSRFRTHSSFVSVRLSSCCLDATLKNKNVIYRLINNKMWRKKVERGG